MCSHTAKSGKINFTSENQKRQLLLRDDQAYNKKDLAGKPPKTRNRLSRLNKGHTGIYAFWFLNDGNHFTIFY
jgi:hypothetical protein